MKRSVVTILVLALAACSGQSPSEVQGIADAVPAQTNEPTVEEAFNPIPFNPESGVVHLTRLSDVIHFAQDKLGDQSKGQFETTETFEVRLASAKEQLAPLDFNQTYVLADPNSGLRYDADREIYSLWAEPHCFNVPTQFIDWHACQLESQTLQTKVDGTDIVGRSVEVTKSRGPTYFALLTPPDARKFAKPNHTHVLPNECPVSLKRAEALYGTFRIGYGVRFTRAQIIQGFPHVSSASLDVPIDVYHSRVGIPATITHLVCFDGATGEVLYQRAL